MTFTYEVWLCLIAIFREARGQSQAARIGIWWALHNRVGMAPFRPTLVRCILQPEQVSSFNPGSTDAVFANDGIPEDWAAWQEIEQIPAQVTTDTTGGAVYWESEPLDQLDAVRARDPWFAVDKMTVQLDGVRFYHA
jgi:hypothetical protein